MRKTVVAVFENIDNAETAARRMKEQGFRHEDISMVARRPDENQTEAEGFQGRQENPVATNDNISNGTVVGGVIGGVAGLLLGAGALTIPGLGIVAAAGPIIGLIGGVATGGIVGGLTDLGIPMEDSRRLEEHVRKGQTIFSVSVEEFKVTDVENILRTNGAHSIQVY